MKIKVTSTFHGEGLNVSFTGCTEGLNIRRLIGPRSKYCLDYSNNNSHVCGCGFPVAWADWEAPEGFEVYDKFECDKDGDGYGHGYVAFRIGEKRTFEP